MHGHALLQAGPRRRKWRATRRAWPLTKLTVLKNSVLRTLILRVSVLSLFFAVMNRVKGRNHRHPVLVSRRRSLGPTFGWKGKRRSGLIIPPYRNTAESVSIEPVKANLQSN